MMLRPDHFFSSPSLHNRSLTEGVWPSQTSLTEECQQTGCLLPFLLEEGMHILVQGYSAIQEAPNLQLRWQLQRHLWGEECLSSYGA